MATFASKDEALDVIHIPTQTITHNTNTYEIKQLYGEGTFGKVYKCNKNNTCEVFAIKQIKIKDNNTERLKHILDSFKHEYELLTKLKKECKSNPIVCIIEHFEHEGNYYIVMEDLYALEYKELIYAPTSEPDDILLKLMNKLCESIIKLHSIIDEKGNILVHRDIKLDNIMYKIDEKGEVFIKFIDFGASCFECSTIPTGSLMYADPYLSDKIIELMQKGKVLKTNCTSTETEEPQYCYQAGDIYSMGIVFIAMILKNDWILCIPQLDKIFNLINTEFKNNLIEKVKYTNMVTRYFINNFIIIENSINLLVEEDISFYKFNSKEEYQTKIKNIYKKINPPNDSTISFVPIDEQILSNITYIKYDIRKLINIVFKVKMVLSKLNYDVNLFSFPINKRYIKAKRIVLPPPHSHSIENIILPPPPPPHSPSKKRKPSHSPSHSSHSHSSHSHSHTSSPTNKKTKKENNKIGGNRRRQKNKTQKNKKRKSKTQKPTPKL